MQEFKAGQRVKVEYEGVVESPARKSIYVRAEAEYDPAIGSCHWVRLDAKNVKVTLADPKDWPPQVGDIWEADGEEWFVRKNQEKSNLTVLSSETARQRPNQDDFKALNPVLVRRRGQ